LRIERGKEIADTEFEGVGVGVFAAKEGGVDQAGHGERPLVGVDGIVFHIPGAACFPVGEDEGDFGIEATGDFLAEGVGHVLRREDVECFDKCLDAASGGQPHAVSVGRRRFSGAPGGPAGALERGPGGEFVELGQSAVEKTAVAGKHPGAGEFRCLAQDHRGGGGIGAGEGEGFAPGFVGGGVAFVPRDTGGAQFVQRPGAGDNGSGEGGAGALDKFSPCGGKVRVGCIRDPLQERGSRLGGQRAGEVIVIGGLAGCRGCRGGGGNEGRCRDYDGGNAREWQTGASARVLENRIQEPDQGCRKGKPHVGQDSGATREV
jgi:hypothetical protein